MPTQWRTIAPIVGRTATQCLERYQKLLDDAEAKDNEELGLGAGDNPDAMPAEGSARGGLRTGEIDTDPETRPARPDPIDMDDDEKEMLSEARARLANTQGKKAKRKARERQLEEARRLAFLQKKRELKAAGINLRAKKKLKGMDYNADIPFEKQPAPGFYDVTEEQAKVFAAPVGRSLRELEGGKRKQDDDDEESKKKEKGDDAGKKNQTAQFVAAREAQIKRLKEQEQVIRRRKLALPTPQVGEAELENIVKIGQAGETAREMVNGGGDDATGKLLGDYETLGQARMTRTPRTQGGASEDNILAEARSLRQMSSVQTPLLGEENTPFHGRTTDFGGATPQTNIVQTPNPLATPRGAPLTTPRTIPGVGATPRSVRDSLHINDDYSAYGETPMNEKSRAKAARRALQAGFAALPRPENNIVLEEAEEEEEGEGEGEGEFISEEDAADRDARLKAAREREIQLELERRSSVVKKGLPRPIAVNPASIVAELNATVDPNDDLASALRAVNLEVASLMRHDSLAHPLPGTSVPGGTASDYDMPDDDYVSEAKKAIHLELAGALGLPGASEDQVRIIVSEAASDDAFTHSWAVERESLILDPVSGKWVEEASLSPSQLSAAYSAMIASSRERIISEATRASKAEKKLGKQLGGYANINAKARQGIIDTIEEIQATKRDLETFTMLRTMEEAAGPGRIEAKRTEVATLERRERDLQARYAEINDERRALVESVEKLEEDKVVLEAQLALDAQEAMEA